MLKQLAAVALLTLAPAMGLAQGAERSLTLEVDATVTGVDAETRAVVLENAATGLTEVILAGPEVVNFDQIEVGDTVKALYTVGISARMADKGEVDSMAALDGRAAEGEKPGAVAGTAVTFILEFLAFDADKSIATVKMSDGVEEQIEVASEEGAEFAKGLSAGDMVALTFTEGVAVGIVEE